VGLEEEFAHPHPIRHSRLRDNEECTPKPQRASTSAGGVVSRATSSGPSLRASGARSTRGTAVALAPAPSGHASPSSPGLRGATPSGHVGFPRARGHRVVGLSPLSDCWSNLSRGGTAHRRWEVRRSHESETPVVGCNADGRPRLGVLFISLYSGYANALLDPLRQIWASPGTTWVSSPRLASRAGSSSHSRIAVALGRSTPSPARPGLRFARCPALHGVVRYDRGRPFRSSDVLLVLFRCSVARARPPKC